MKKIIGRKALVGLFALAVGTVLLVRCGSTTASGESITIGGTFTAARGAKARGTFTGHQLYCLTFASPPVAGSGTVDASDVVSLTIAGSNLTLGCFILDADGDQVATLMFTAGANTSQHGTFSGSVDLGTIEFDETNGTAVATVTDAANLVTTVTGLSCPVGAWESEEEEVSSGPCDGETGYTRASFAEKPDGTVIGAYFSKNTDTSASTCGDKGDNFQSVTVDGNTITLDIPTGPFENNDLNGQSGGGGTYTFGSCASAGNNPNIETVTFTANEACTTLTMTSGTTLSITGCQACIPGELTGTGGCVGCGSVTCTNTLSADEGTFTKR